jgi:ABC-type sugar transport system substrate-binding protein
MNNKKRSILVMFVAVLFILPAMLWAGGEQEAPSPQSGSMPAEVEGAEPIDYPISGLGWETKSDVRAKKRYVLGCVVKNTTNPYMIAQLKGFEEAGKAMGFDTITLAPAKQDNVEEQARIVEDLIQRGVDGIAIHPADSNGIVPAVEKAVAAGIPVAVIGTNANTDKKLVHCGTQYYMTGVVIAEEVAKKIGGKGNMVLLTGPPQAQNAHERNAGIKFTLEKYPDIKVIAEQPANFRRTEGMQVMENLIQKFGDDIDAVIGANDETAMGAVMAIEAAGMADKGIIVAGFDCNEDGSYALRDGRMYVSFNSDPPSSAWLAAAYLVMYLNDGTLPPPRYIPYPDPENHPDAIVTKANVDKYIENLAWWKAP